MPPTFTWQALDGQGWPASENQERQFVADLRRAASGDATATRTATTCVLNALRSGATLSQVLDLLPGVNPAELLASYRLLSRRLNASRNAWTKIADAGNEATFLASAHKAAVLMPIPVHRLQFVLNQITVKENFPQLVAAVVRHVEEVTESSQAVETRLARFHTGDRAGIRLGRSLHDVSQPGLWGSPFFLPARVGQLSPIRAADLRKDPR